jgi:predicted DNA-binding protein with PD1-like motif
VKNIKNKILHNLPLKLLALFVSMMLWLIVVNLNDPVIDKPFTGIEVELINGEQLDSEGKVYEILENTGTVSVTVYAPRSVIDELSKEDIHAVADLNEISVSNTIEITAYSDRDNEKIEDIYIPKNFLKLNIENALRSQVYITPEITGEPADDYIIGDISMSQNIVRLTGPESIINQISAAVVTVDVSGMTSSIATNTEILLYDEEGNEIDNVSVKKNVESVSVNAQILETKKVPIIYSTMGTVANGYVLSGEIVSNPATVLIAGTNEVLSEVSSISIPETELNVTGINTDMIQVVDVQEFLPEGIILGNKEYSGKATVTVGVEREERTTFVFNEQTMLIDNGDPDFNISVEILEDNLPLELAGLGETLDSLTDISIKGRIDMNEIITSYELDSLKAGVYQANVYFTMPEGVRLVNAVSVKVIVEDKEE